MTSIANLTRLRVFSLLLGKLSEHSHFIRLPLRIPAQKIAVRAPHFFLLFFAPVAIPRQLSSCQNTTNNAMYTCSNTIPRRCQVYNGFQMGIFLFCLSILARRIIAVGTPHYA